MNEILAFLPTLGLAIAVAAIAFMALRVWTDSDQPVRQAAASLLQVLNIPFERASAATGQAASWLWDHAARAYRSVDPPAKRWTGWIVIGAVFNAVVVIINLYAEWWLLVMALPILGFAITPFAMPPDAASITALAFVTLGVFWGGVLSEALRLTTVTPWSQRSERDRTALGALSLVVLVALVWAVCLIGILRGLEMAAGAQATDLLASMDPYAAVSPLDAPTAPIEPDALDAQYRRLTRTLPVQINALLAVVAALSFMLGKWALTHTAVYVAGLAFFVSWLVVWPIHFVLTTIAAMVAALREELVPDFAKLAHLGLSAFADTLRDIRDDLFGREHAPEPDAVEAAIDELGAAVRAAAAPPNGASPRTPA